MHFRNQGFSLIELLLVMAFTSLMLAVTIPAVSSIGQAGSIEKSSGDIAAFLDLARSHARANNATVDVGFRWNNDGVAVVAVAGREGTNFSRISRIQRFPRVQIAGVAAGDSRPVADFQVAVPLGNEIGGFEIGSERFDYIVQFNSRGEARSLSNSLSRVIEIGIVPLMAKTGAPANYGVVQIAGLSGDVSVHRP